MGKKYLNINVYEAAMQRIAYLFDEFDNVLLSGGTFGNGYFKRCVLFGGNCFFGGWGTAG